MFEEEKTSPFRIENGELRGAFADGMQIKGVAHKEFWLRDSTVEDMIDAEQEANVGMVITFANALLARQLVRVGDYPGPFTAAMVKRLSKRDWRLLRAAQTELDALGESGPATAPAS